jgi:hypothetical protein
VRATTRIIDRANRAQQRGVGVEVVKLCVDEVGLRLGEGEFGVADLQLGRDARFEAHARQTQGFGGLLQPFSSDFEPLLGVLQV